SAMERSISSRARSNSPRIAVNPGAVGQSARLDHPISGGALDLLFAPPEYLIDRNVAVVPRRQEHDSHLRLLEPVAESASVSQGVYKSGFRGLVAAAIPIAHRDDLPYLRQPEVVAARLELRDESLRPSPDLIIRPPLFPLQRNPETVEARQQLAAPVFGATRPFVCLLDDRSGPVRVAVAVLRGAVCLQQFVVRFVGG